MDRHTSYLLALCTYLSVYLSSCCPQVLHSIIWCCSWSGLCVFLCVQASRVWLKTVPCRCQKTLSCRCCQQRSSRTNIDATSSETTLRCVSVSVCECQGSAVMATEKAETCGRGVRSLPCFFPGVNLWISFTLSDHQPVFHWYSRHVLWHHAGNKVITTLMMFN